ncbi:MAG: collagenase [Saprospiraceae bacterium]
MKKIIKKSLIGGFSLIGISFLIWLILLLNPSLMYGNHTDVGKVRIHHNETLTSEMTMIVEQSIELVKKSELYDADKRVDLCLNESKYVYLLQRLSHGGIAATLLNNVGIFVDINPAENYAFWRWEINDNELRKWKLTELIAHEMTHAYQYNDNAFMPLQVDTWKVEGYAEYISRTNRGDLKTNILRLIEEEQKESKGLPWIVLEDGTGTSKIYFRNWLMMEYMMTIKGMTYLEVAADKTPLDDVKNEMINWAK